MRPVIRALQRDGEERWLEQAEVEKFRYGRLIYLEDLGVLAELERTGKERKFKAPRRLRLDWSRVPSFLDEHRDGLDEGVVAFDGLLEERRIFRQVDSVSVREIEVGGAGRPRGSRRRRGPELVLARGPLRLRRLDRLAGPRARRAQPGRAVSRDVRGLDRPARARPAPPRPVARALPGRRRGRTAARRAAAPFGCRAARPPGGDRAGDPGGRGRRGRTGRPSERAELVRTAGRAPSGGALRPSGAGSRPRSAPTRSGGSSGCASCGRTGSAACWPTTWGWARPTR